jgi:3',5'-cyclic AMP phosphodiesterase CpdA
MRRALVVALLALVVAGCGGSGPGAADPDGSTLTATWHDPDGDGFLSRGPGEPLRDRTALARAARPGRTLATLAVITDAHVRDEESPARVPFLDRLGGEFSSTFRPQETLSAQVLDAAVRSIDAADPQAVLVTGDLIDNAQANELALARALLDGGVARPNSGAPGYQGVQQADDPDPAYYRPDVDPPRHPGLLAEAQRSFTSPGLRAPWYPVVGNHDLLVQGNLAPGAQTNAIATGSRKLLGLDAAALGAVQSLRLTPAVVASLLRSGLPGASERGPADPRRRELSAAEVLARLRKASGHGGRGPLLDYAFDVVDGVRAIVLDTTRRGTGAGGLVRPSQTRWLARELQAAGKRPVVLFTHAPLTTAAGGASVLALLDRDPHVVAAIHGDTHRNEISPRSHYWLVGTSSLADYPQEARAFELDRTADGGLVLQTWTVDHDPSDRLAEISRGLAYLDFQGGRVQHFAGTRLDRNVRLYVR